MSNVRLSVGTVPNIYPRLGEELFVQRADGRQQLLTGFDYNREFMKRQMAAVISADPLLRADAATLALEEQMRQHKQQFWEEPQRPLVAAEFVPMDPEAASYSDAEFYSWEVRSPYGKAQMHSSLNGVTEAPSVSEGAEFRKVPIVNAVISYGWNVQDEMVGSRIGYNYAGRRARWARFEVDRAFDEFLLKGGTFSGKSFEGLFNQSGVSIFDADVSGTGDWYTVSQAGATNPETILDDFLELYKLYESDVYRAGSQPAERPDTVAMSDRMETLLRHTPVSRDNRRSLMEELQVRYPEISAWLVHRDLRGINGTATDDRMVMYRRDPRVVAGAIPVPYQEMPILQEPYGQRIYAFGRVAPVEVFDLRLIKYLDVAMSA